MRRPPRPNPAAERGVHVAWDLDKAGWVVALLRPERQDFRGPTLAAAPAWCPVWLLRDELVFGPPA